MVTRSLCAVPFLATSMSPWLSLWLDVISFALAPAAHQALEPASHAHSNSYLAITA